MSVDDQKTIIACLLYVLDKTAGLDVYHALKVLYFAEREHLVDYGMRMTEDDYFAIDYGPVPTALYDATKGRANSQCPQLLSLYKEAVKRAGKDAPNVLLPKRKPDMDYLSEAMVECLDKSILANCCLPFGELMRKSHDAAWQEAFEEGKGKISLLSMAKCAGAEEVTLDYLGENIKLDSALRKAGWRE